MTLLTAVRIQHGNDYDVAQAGCTPLLCAAIEGATKVSEYLIKQGAAIDAIDNVSSIKNNSIVSFFIIVFL